MEDDTQLDLVTWKFTTNGEYSISFGYDYISVEDKGISHEVWKWIWKSHATIKNEVIFMENYT